MSSSSALVSCHGMFFHHAQLVAAFAQYTQVRGDWQRSRGFLFLQIQDMHVPMASPFLLHRITHAGGRLREWVDVQDDGRFFVDCIARRIPDGREEYLAFAEQYVADWTLYPKLAAIKTRSPDGMFAVRTEPKLVEHAIPEMTFRPVAGDAPPPGWLAMLALAKGDEMALPFLRLRSVATMCRLFSWLGTGDGWRALSDAFMKAAAQKETPATVLSQMMDTMALAPPVSPLIRALFSARPVLHALYGGSIVRQEFVKQGKWIRGGAFLMTQWKLRTLDAPSLSALATRQDRRGEFLAKCGHGACILPSLGVLLRVYAVGRLPEVTLRPTHVGDVLGGRELGLAEAEARQYHSMSRVIINADPSVERDLDSFTPEQFANVFIIGGHFLSLAQLRTLIASLPSKVNKKIVLYGCPALAPLADAATPGTRHVISAVRELAGIPTAQLDDLRLPLRIDIQALLTGALPYAVGRAQPPTGEPLAIRSPSQLFAACYRMRSDAAPIHVVLTGLQFAGLDDLFCYAYLLNRFRAQILETGAGDAVRAEFEGIAQRPPTIEYWSDADFKAGLR